MHAAHENSPEAGRRAGRAKTTQWSRRSWPSEKHRAGTLEVKDRGRSSSKHCIKRSYAVMLTGAKHPATSMLISLRKRLKISSHYLITQLVEVAGFFASLRMIRRLHFNSSTFLQ